MTPLPKSLFWTITGRDFGRSIAWAKKQPRLRDLIAVQRIKKEAL